MSKEPPPYQDGPETFFGWCDKLVDARVKGTAGWTSYAVAAAPYFPRKARYWKTIEKSLRKANAPEPIVNLLYEHWQVYARLHGLALPFIGGPLDGTYYLRLQSGGVLARINGANKTTTAKARPFAYVLSTDGAPRYLYEHLREAAQK